MSDGSDFESAVRQAVADEVEFALAQGVRPGDKHRQLMDRAKLLVAAYVWPRSAHVRDPALIAQAQDHVRALRTLQGASGLFIGGDNVDSPPDSSFTVNDVCDTLQILRSAGAGASDAAAGLAELAAELDEIADAVEPALVVGGVHTPNHRWEISAALARLHRRRPSPHLRDRAEEWLAEGVDITPDGIYSERSANYAAYVSNPSLAVISDVFARDDARAAVIRNLESTLGLIHPDDTVETVHSRRQDQLRRFSVAPYLIAYRRYAIELGRGDFAWAAERALRAGIPHPSSTLAELVLHPQIGDRMPDALEPVPQREWERSSLVVDTSPHRRIVVFGGTDYARFRRVRSGLSTNPTFLRMFAGDAVLDSVRLSRDFFGLGPFRADGLTTHRGGGDAEGYELTETVSAAYYQPLGAAGRSPAGEYDLTDDGRFFGSMSFPERSRDEVTLRTVIEILPSSEGVVLDITLDGPDCRWALELAFRDGGRFEGVTTVDGEALLTRGIGRYRVGDSAIAFEAGEDYRADGIPRYLPGEDYAFLSATDAADGARVYLTGRSPGRLIVTLRAEAVDR